VLRVSLRAPRAHRAIGGKKTAISFKNDVLSIQEPSTGSQKLRLLEIKDFIDVNAISDDCSIKVGPNLTLVYGGNGSGKSGIGRLLCNACFSRGEREILPNVRTDSTDQAEARATFVVQDDSDVTTEIEYSIGDNIDELKRFGVFDSESVLIKPTKPKPRPRFPQQMPRLVGSNSLNPRLFSNS
jgi:ABC-type glutathione transport system ATPase component